jgi:nitrile hydratase subunit beta
MNGGQDMGGMHGFGRVVPEPNEPAFHEEWERRVFALTVAMGATGEWNLDASRHARENQPPGEYLSQTYYEIWLAGLEALLQQTGLATREELREGRAIGSPKPVKRTLAAADVAAAMARGTPARREAATPAKFKPGDRVRTRNINPPTHTRLPRYVRGHEGEVVAVHGAHVFPDVHAHGGGEDAQWLYTVRFQARELFGEVADPSAAVSVDAWEPYLEPA